MSRSRPNADFLRGEWRRPPNDLQLQKVGGGHKAIHDDETAAKIGFGKAPIHGTVHWSQFTPLLIKAFGPAWFETGSISVHFVTPVSHLEPTRAFMSKPVAAGESGNGLVAEIWMEHVDGRVVLNGTASVGVKPNDIESTAKNRMAKAKPIEGNLVFARHPIGTKSTNIETARIDFQQTIGPLFPFSLNEKLECITEWHPWFSEDAGGKSPWGQPILPPECLNAIMLGLCGTREASEWPGIPGDSWLENLISGRTPVGLFGGCEVWLHAGPVCPGVEYDVTREIVGKGETRGTEYEWIRTYLWEKGTKKLVAEMTLQNMMLKGSFEGYQELRAKSDARPPLSKL